MASNISLTDLAMLKITDRDFANELYHDNKNSTVQQQRMKQ